MLIKKYVVFFMLLSIIFLIIGCENVDKYGNSKEEDVGKEEKNSTGEEENLNDEDSLELLREIKDIKNDDINLYFKIYGEPYHDRGNAKFIKRIDIYNHSDLELLQEIELDSAWTPDLENYGVHIEDMNFNGYKDFRVQRSLGASFNVPFKYWLWDEEKCRFVKCDKLAKIISPEFNQEEETITSWIRINAVRDIEYTYQYIDDVPTKIKEVEKGLKDINGESHIYHIKRELEDRDMKVTEERYEPYEEK